uniref:NADH-ubiquinone oxidoreductase chain 3 n=1 Tax=Stylochoplana maculata TaxID=1495083 RepID=A0A0F6PZT1_9PLAT|nr:NADH dehydrogenase subunit 3 [Stylochoplana maculata]
MGNIIFSSILIISGLSALVILWTFWTSRKNFLNSREKSSPFECGFDPKDKARVPFSLRFFLIIIIFLIFDVEISVLLGLPYQLDYDNFKGRLGVLLFLWVLLLGTLEEWRRGILDWKK